VDETSGEVTPDTVAAEVRAWLGRRNRSGRSLAQELGWTEPYLSRRLTGSVPFDVADLLAVASLLDVPVTVFFDTPALAYPGGSISALIHPLHLRKLRHLKVAA
jgi:transcriptional regulator with XRE-family HTH domain